MTEIWVSAYVFSFCLPWAYCHMLSLVSPESVSHWLVPNGFNQSLLFSIFSIIVFFSKNSSLYNQKSFSLSNGSQLGPCVPSLPLLHTHWFSFGMFFLFSILIIFLCSHLSSLYTFVYSSFLSIISLIFPQNLLIHLFWSWILPLIGWWKPSLIPVPFLHKKLNFYFKIWCLF